MDQSGNCVMEFVELWRICNNHAAAAEMLPATAKTETELAACGLTSNPES
jgi:hypothetical protein